MLSYDSLLAHAKERGLPAGKARGLVREYLQVLILKALYGPRRASGLVFLGGTALRLGYGLPRFSEDLDFDAESLSFREWRTLLEEAAHALSISGLSSELRSAEKGSLLSGDLRFEGFLQAYRLSESPGEELRVKLEANRPRYSPAAEPRVIAGFGEMFPVPFAAPGLAFSEKIMALLNRELGRDVFDIFFMAGKSWAPDPGPLSVLGVKASPRELILGRVGAWKPAQLAAMARKLEPFLFEPAQAGLVAQARELLPGTLDYLK